MALSRRRVHESYEIGGTPTAAPAAGTPSEQREGRERRLDLVTRLGGPQPDGGPLRGGSRPLRWCPERSSGRRLRARRDRGRRRPTPASRAARAIPRRCPRPPAAASAPRRAPRAPAVPDPPQQGVSRVRGQLQHVEAQPGQQPHRRPALPSAQPSSFSYHRATAPLYVGGDAGRWDSEGHTPSNSRPGAGVTQRVSIRSHGCPVWGACGSIREVQGCSPVAEGTRGAPHGLSVLAGKTFLVGRGDTRSGRLAFAIGVLMAGVSVWPAGTSSRTIRLELLSAVREEVSAAERG